jgi:hypothetical protein
MKIRKSIIASVRGYNDKAEQTKALAMILFYQMRVSENESEHNRHGIRYWQVCDFSYNKIRRVTGLHIATIKKRLRVAECNGWAKRIGKDLIFDRKALRSSHNRNNYTPQNDFTRIVDLQDWLLAHIIVNIQEAKEYAKDIFGKVAAPKNLNEYKKARRVAKERYPNHTEFADNGISYRCLVENTGVRRTKLKGLLRFAETRGIIARKRNRKRISASETLLFKEMERHDCLLDYLKQTYGRLLHYFFYGDNAFLCFANTYSIPSAPAGNY